MDESPLQVLVTESAVRDLQEIDEYWTNQGEPERGEQYVHDLMEMAKRELSIPIHARSDRIVRASLLPETRERVVFKGSCRVIYRMDEEREVIHVLRFWHTHRDEPDWSGL